MEDIAIMRAIPNMTVVHPSDAAEMKQVIKYAAEYDGPMYIRVARDAVPRFIPDDYQFELGKSFTLKEGSDVAIITYGELIGDVMQAVDMLEKKSVKARVLICSSIKPIDRGAVTRAAEETGKIVTVDNHNIFGGIGSAVSEIVCESCPVPVKRLGVKDIPGRSGKNPDMKRYFGLRAEDIEDVTMKLVEG
jgi:transketolase